jgi:hypothetical protein
VDKKHASNDADASEAMHLINFVIDQSARQQRAVEGVSQADSADSLVGGKRGSIAVAGIEGRRKGVRKEGETVIPNEERQAYIKQKTTGEKMAAGKVLMKNYQAETDKFLNKLSRTFMGRLRKPVQCFYNHCRQDVLVFERRFKDSNGKIDWSHFSCSGVGEMICINKSDDGASP